MWYYNGEIIKTPKVMTSRDKRYSKEIFQDSSALSSLGIKPYRSVVPDSRYYLAGSYSVDTSGDEVIGTYAGTAKDLSNLRTNMLSTARSCRKKFSFKKKCYNSRSWRYSVFSCFGWS